MEDAALGHGRVEQVLQLLLLLRRHLATVPRCWRPPRLRHWTKHRAGLLNLHWPLPLPLVLPWREVLLHLGFNCHWGVLSIR